MNGDKIRTAAYLVQCALHRPALKATEPSYREALAAWETDPSVREAMVHVCGGLGLRILDINEHGAFLASDSLLSPFRPRLINISSRLANVDERMMFGLIVTTIMAIYYENQAHLYGDLAPSLSAREVVDRVAEIAEARREERDHNEMHDASDIDEACDYVLALPKSAPTETGQIKAGTLRRIVDYAFAHLAEEGYVKLRSEDDGGTYFALRKFRIYAKEFAVMEAYHTVKDVLKKQEGGPHA